MRRPGFLALHGAYIALMGLLSLPVLYSRDNLAAIDAYFVGCSASTGSGLNTVDLGPLPLYQQLYLYFVPMLTSPCFVNIVVVVLRLRWFDKRINGLGSRDSEEIGGVEYRSLKLLLPIVISYFFGLHLLGGAILSIWVRFADAKYTAYLDQLAQNHTWWAFYTTQSLMDNLGFTLTPDAMVHFRDAAIPLLLLTALALAGETLYPVLLRFAAIKIFPIFFEVVSAYVGISHPSVSSSLSSKFSVAGKIVVCAMMIRGRHRGMPDRLDPTILLPSEREREEPKSEGFVRHMPLLEGAVVEKPTEILNMN
ncbi:potassium uptake transporter [Purpureocillium lavendulum]|uniref:Potassium uptake transporter n=1 Tax=Purpureocillium lavendulum TaxID=1247861 RepID=A0AB34FGZ8_9HYPO|nr:potassium uptake transporter [Purpureocillium lavendulum]